MPVGNLVRPQLTELDC